MQYISTRGQAPALPFEEAMLTGLARDGGLYVPETIPQMSTADIRALQGLSYEEIAKTMSCPIGTVRSRIFRARDAIEKKLQPLLEG